MTLVEEALSHVLNSSLCPMVSPTSPLAFYFCPEFVPRSGRAVVGVCGGVTWGWCCGFFLMDGIERQTAGLTAADDKLCHWLQWWQAAVYGKAVSPHPTLTSVPVG